MSRIRSISNLLPSEMAQKAQDGVDLSEEIARAYGDAIRGGSEIVLDKAGKVKDKVGKKHPDGSDEDSADPLGKGKGSNRGILSSISDLKRGSNDRLDIRSMSEDPLPKDGRESPPLSYNERRARKKEFHAIPQVNAAASDPSSRARTGSTIRGGNRRKDADAAAAAPPGRNESSLLRKASPDVQVAYNRFVVKPRDLLADASERQLLREGEVTELIREAGQEKRRVLLLFSDALLISKPSRTGAHLYLRWYVHLRPNVSPRALPADREFSLQTPPGSPNFVFRCESVADRDSWVRKLRRALDVLLKESAFHGPVYSARRRSQSGFAVDEEWSRFGDYQGPDIMRAPSVAEQRMASPARKQREKEKGASGRLEKGSGKAKGVPKSEPLDTPAPFSSPQFVEFESMASVGAMSPVASPLPPVHPALQRSPASPAVVDDPFEMLAGAPLVQAQPQPVPRPVPVAVPNPYVAPAPAPSDPFASLTWGAEATFDPFASPLVPTPASANQRSPMDDPFNPFL